MEQIKSRYYSDDINLFLDQIQYFVDIFKEHDIVYTYDIWINEKGVFIAKFVINKE